MIGAAFRSRQDYILPVSWVALCLYHRLHVQIFVLCAFEISKPQERAIDSFCASTFDLVLIPEAAFRSNNIDISTLSHVFLGIYHHSYTFD